MNCKQVSESYRYSLKVGEHVALEKVDEVNVRVGGDDTLGLGLALDSERYEEVDRCVLALPIAIVGDVGGHQRVDLRVA